MTYHAIRDTGQPGAPLVATFHGTGGNEHQFHGLANQLFPGAWVTSPRGDVTEHGALRYFRRTGEGVYDMDDLAVRTAAMADFLNAEIAQTGARRRIALGYSNGANIAASVALVHPDIFTDLVLLHPLIPWVPAPQTGLAGRRVLITAGERDPICPAPLTRQLVDYLADQGAAVTVHWHPGGHDIAQSEVAAIASFAKAA